MRKEFFVAILLGLGLGLLVTYLIYRANTALTSGPVELLASPSPTPETEISDITLFSPEDESIVAEAAVSVAGSTDPSNFVVVYINDLPSITTADDTGNFSISGELDSGSNVITVHSINEDGGISILERTVIFTTQSLTGQTNTATDSADTQEDQ